MSLESQNNQTCQKENFLDKDFAENAINKILLGYPHLETLKENQDFNLALDHLKNAFLEKQKTITREDFYANGFRNKEQFRVEYDRYSGKVSVPQFSVAFNGKFFLTPGKMVSGLEWGEDFYLDPKTFHENSLGEKIYQKYMLTWLETKTLSLLDKFIVENEIKRNEHRDLLKKDAYLAIKERQDKKTENLPLGIIAEKMIKSFLSRISIDHPGLEFNIVPTNTYQDVELKIDILITSRNKIVGRGAKIEVKEEDDGDEIHERKIQFTIKDNFDSLKLKNDQLQKRGDIILIQMPGEEVKKAYNKWAEKKHKEISTPDQYIDEEMQIMILEKMLQDFVVIENLPNLIKNAIKK